MRAILARNGQRLLVCQRRAAPSCALYATPVRRRPLSRPVTFRNFQRTFLNGVFQKPPRDVRQPEYEPGWMHIMVWRSRMLDNVRPPPRKELVEAWKKLMQSKLRNRVPVNSTQALQCRRLLEYLAELPAQDLDTKSLSASDLSIARQVLIHIEPYERSNHHLDFAKSIYSLWLSGNYGGNTRPPETRWVFLVKSMCAYGGSLEALQQLYARWEQPEYFVYLNEKDKLLELVAQGLSREGHETELVELINYAEGHGVPYNSELQHVIVDFFARRDRVPETQRWFNKPTENNYSRVRAYRTISLFAVRNNLQEWATSKFLELGQTQPPKKFWDVILQAILLSGKSLKEVDTMMSHMVGPVEKLSPDIHTINGLLRVAAETHNAALGTEILALAAARDLAPNGETYLVLLQLHLQTENLAAAQDAYKQVKHLDPWTNESNLRLYTEFRRLTNDYLVTLCRQGTPDFKYISSILASVEEEQMRLDPTTVGVLCLRFLENDQHFEVMDILAIHSFLYSETEREVIQDAFISFCLDPNTSTNRAWGAYQLLHQFFQDTGFDKRVRLMEAFFERKRPDMASHVFGHMRAHRNNSYHPKIDTYITCLEGFAQHPDSEGLEMVHNMLKMDTTIQPSIRLYTALMLAYTACDRPLIALDFWQEITQSRTGPSYASLEAVFWALERKAGGHVKAREIWDRIERMDLDIPPSVYNAYIGAVAGSGNEKEIRGLILKMASFVGSEPDETTLAIAYNALPGQELQTNFQDWARVRYRDVWEKLLKIGRRMNEYSLCQFRIKRILKA